MLRLKDLNVTNVESPHFKSGTNTSSINYSCKVSIPHSKDKNIPFPTSAKVHLLFQFLIVKIKTRLTVVSKHEEKL